MTAIVEEAQPARPDAVGHPDAVHPDAVGHCGAARHGRDRGFTLIELLIAIVLSGIIAGVITAAMATALRVADSTTKQIADSTDAGLISAFLFRDAQAAGTTDPATVGVSTSNTSSGWADCPQNGDLIVRFSWLDREAVASGAAVVVTYALDDAAQMTRRVCQGDTVVDVVLGRSITAATARCDPDPSCRELVETVLLTVSGSATASPFTYTLEASLRSEKQPLPGTAGSMTVPLVILGDARSSLPCPILTLQGRARVTVIGDAVVATDCGASPIGGSPGNLVDLGGETRMLTDIVDPFAGLVPPATACGEGENPSPIGGSNGPSGAAHPATAQLATVHPDSVVISDVVHFAPGTYVFCEGLEIRGGARVTGSGVFLFVLGGTLTVDSTAEVSLTAPDSGEYQNLLAWVATSQHVVVGGDRVSRYAGYIYAPTSDVVVAGAGPTHLGGVIARSANFHGENTVRLGLPVPVITIGQTGAPDGEVGVPYPTTTLSADGGQGPHTWSALGLPPGVSVDRTSGVLSGIPTESGLYNATFTVRDGTAAASSADIQITIRAALSIGSPTVLPAGQVGMTYPTTLITPVGGVGPFAWAATGLPEGVSLDPATGVISGTPMVDGSFPVAVTVTDASPTIASTQYIIVVTARLTVATTTLPDGRVGVGYPVTQLVASGGTAAFTWSASGLPAGLAMDASGALTGVPNEPGSFNVVVAVADAVSAVAAVRYTVIIDPPPGVATAVLPRGQVGVSYPAMAFTPSGGTAPFTWSAAGLPAGLAIDRQSGGLSGTPTAVGSSAVVVSVVDATTRASSAGYSIVIDAALAVAGPTSLPGGQVDVPYPSTTASSSGGTSEREWSATGLPVGVQIDASTGVISGTPVAAGSFSAVVRVTDALAVSASRTYTVVVSPRLTISTVTLPGGQLAVAYVATTATTSGGTAPLTWSASGLPGGLTIAASTGAVTGSPTAAGTYSSVLSVTDAVGATAAKVFSVIVTSSVPPGCPADPAGWRGEYFANVSLTGSPTICRDDPSINFDWSSASPGIGIPNDNFSARWTRSHYFVAGTYTFALGSGDGGRLYIDGVLVLDRWRDQSYPNPVPTVRRKLSTGDHQIVMEYYERSGFARATLSWSNNAGSPT